MKKQLWHITLVAAAVQAFATGLALAAEPAPTPPQTVATMYSCRMHPQVRWTAPAACPLCGMTMSPVAPAAPTAPGAPKACALGDPTCHLNAAAGHEAMDMGHGHAMPMKHGDMGSMGSCGACMNMSGMGSMRTSPAPTNPKATTSGSSGQRTTRSGRGCGC